MTDSLRDKGCSHCPDGHRSPARRPWSAWVAEARDGDGQPTTIHVARSNGAHVAESDAQWIRDMLNGRFAVSGANGAGTGQGATETGGITASRPLGRSRPSSSPSSAETADAVTAEARKRLDAAHEALWESLGNTQRSNAAKAELHAAREDYVEAIECALTAEQSDPSGVETAREFVERTITPEGRRKLDALKTESGGASAEMLRDYGSPWADMLARQAADLAKRFPPSETILISAEAAQAWADQIEHRPLAEINTPDPHPFSVIPRRQPMTFPRCPSCEARVDRVRAYYPDYLDQFSVHPCGHRFAVRPAAEIQVRADPAAKSQRLTDASREEWA